MKRHLTNIHIIPAEAPGMPNPVVLGLANDGTLWNLRWVVAQGWVWKDMPSLPQPPSLHEREIED